jgi:DNA transformation protein
LHFTATPVCPEKIKNPSAVKRSSPKKKSSDVVLLKGLGPKSSAMLNRIGVRTIEQLRARDPFEVYAALKAAVPAVSLNMLYGLIGAIEDVHWQEVKRSRRTEILIRLDEMGIAPRTRGASTGSARTVRAPARRD